MSNDDKLLEARNRAAQAEALMRNELLVEGFANLEAAYIQFWRETRPEQSMAREKLYVAINVIGKVRDHLGMIIANGKIADAELKMLIERRQRAKAAA